MNSSKPSTLVHYYPPHHPIRNPASDGGVNDMLQRVNMLEKNVQEIKTDLAVIKFNYATKADISATKAAISDAKFGIIVWVIGAMFTAQLMPAVIGAIINAIR